MRYLHGIPKAAKLNMVEGENISKHNLGKSHKSVHSPVVVDEWGEEKKPSACTRYNPCHLQAAMCSAVSYPWARALT